MGEAKRRGSFEERKRIASKRDIKKREEEKQKILDRERNITPQQKADRAKAMLICSMFAGFAGGMGKIKYNKALDADSA